MRLIRYPSVSLRRSADAEPAPLSDDDGADIRAGEHSDYGSLTLLFRQPSDQGGLQVRLEEKPGNGHRWVDVPCLADAIVVNIGDALEFWTAGRLRSTVHRVAFPRNARENVARLSIPVFIQPDKHVLLAPIGVDEPDSAGPEFLEVLKRKGYASADPVTSHEHLTRRIQATYGNA